jgi:hypothetical protein
LFGGVSDVGVATGLPFHVDGPFFVRDAAAREGRRLVLTAETELAFQWQATQGGGGGDSGSGGSGGGGSGGSSSSGGGDDSDPVQRKVAAERAAAQWRASSGGFTPHGSSSNGGGSGTPGHASVALSPEAQRAVGRWNEALLEAAMLELVPALLADLRDALRPR